MKYSYENHVVFQGRVYQDTTLNAAFMDWTCSGFRCTFTGTVLRAKFLGISELAIGSDTELEHPYIGVTVNNGDVLVKRICITPGESWYTLFESENSAQHTISVWKLSENFRGKCGLLALDTDGQILDPVSLPYDRHIEFVGDSITCGYGNEAANRDDPFKPEEENGFHSFAMHAARELNAQASCVCVSGITVAVDPDSEFSMDIPGMEELYAYTDRPYESRKGNVTFTPWDFSSHPVDAVVINLGTNDVNAYKMAADEAGLAAARRFFKSHYTAFIETVRQCNGPDTFILCTLGSLDYFLYDEIRDIVAAYKEKTGDNRIDCFKFGAVVQWSEGFGAVGHPSSKTHLRMGRELAAKLRQCL